MTLAGQFGPQAVLVGEWEEVVRARAAYAGFLTAAGRGLGLAAAIEFAREIASDPAALDVGRKKVFQALLEEYGMHAPRGFFIEIRRPDLKWEVRVTVGHS